MSETKTKRKPVPNDSILKRMEDSNPEMRDAFESWVASVWNVAPGPALDLGVTRPFDVPPQRWKMADYEITWTQIVEVCRADPMNVSVIVSEIFEEFTAEAVKKAKLFFHAAIRNAERREAELAMCKPIEIDVNVEIDGDAAMFIALHNSSLWALDVQRKIESDEDQTLWLWRRVAEADYVVAVMFLDEGALPTVTWVKGRDLAIKRGHEANPPIEATHVMYVPNLDMLEVVLIAFGDCPAADRLRAKLCQDEGRDFQGQCRHLSTINKMTLFYGAQPTWPDFRL